MSSGKGSANRRRCMSPPPIPPIRISRVGRVIKPPLNRSTGERIVYDFHGNPLRACASVTVRDDGEPEISPKLVRNANKVLMGCTTLIEIELDVSTQPLRRELLMTS